eukprot:CAMPEP_0117426614 /NCGR_PEP_ID=MMETSP0758-20121206/6674_1 /TAXON_ID=63605 /ORGANISM="Percolomonas cosmopolitus, Strain AE-1 (ATCC 50343)" /LENGTH=211 /DNA_ID=CAMNT_0005211851 /DNA_START=27 /DNA_END=659 /DNA_ORIENTATION=+
MTNSDNWKMNEEKEPETKEELVYYSHPVCPFGQRVWIYLEEKKIKYDYVFIELTKERPQWYIDINPKKKVPAIKHDGKILYESYIVTQYLSEVFGDKNDPKPLVSHDAYTRAQERLWVDYCDKNLIGAYYGFLMNQDETKHEELSKKLDDTLTFIEENGLKDYKEGEDKYWFGDRFSIVDLAFAPFFQRFPVIEHYRGYTIPEKLTKIKSW